jgi:hypothetical protein
VEAVWWWCGGVVVAVWWWRCGDGAVVVLCVHVMVACGGAYGVMVWYGGVVWW